MMDPSRNRNRFNEAKEGPGPVFLLEVIIRSTGDFDYQDKPSIYEQTKAKEYFLLEPLQKLWVRPLQTESQYREIRADNQGRVHSDTLDLYFAIAPVSDRLVLMDAVTNEKLSGLGEEIEALQAVESRVEAEARARRVAEKQAETEAVASRQEAGARRQQRAERRQRQRPVGPPRQRRNSSPQRANGCGRAFEISERPSPRFLKTGARKNDRRLRGAYG